MLFDPTTIAIVVPVELGPSIDGGPSVLNLPFGTHDSLLRATISRLLAFDLAKVVVGYRNNAENARVPALLDGLNVELVACPLGASDLELAMGALQATPAEAACMVDPRAPFVSGTVLRRQIEIQLAERHELTLCPLVARGLAGVGIRKDALARLAAVRAAEGGIDWKLDPFNFVWKLAAAFDVRYLDVDERFTCVPIDLAPRVPAELEVVSAFAPVGAAEDYEAVFDAMCARAWNRWERINRPRRPRRTGKPKLLVFHYPTRRKIGATGALELLIEGWDWKRYDGTLVVTAGGDLYEHMKGRFPVEVLPLSMWGEDPDGTPGGRWAADFAATSAFLAEKQPDLVFISGTIPALALACRAAGIPCISWIQQPVMSWPLKVSGTLARRAALPIYDVVICTSHWFEKSLRNAMRPPAGRMAMVTYGVPLERFTPAAVHRDAARRRFGIADDDRVIVQVGTFAEIKRPEVAIQALATVLAKIPKALLAFAGDERPPPYGTKAALERLAESLGVRERVRFLGDIEDVEAVYAAADVHLHCGNSETFGMVLVEAMAMKKPVVSVDMCGPAEIVVDRETGRLVRPPGEPGEIGDALVEVLSDPEWAAQLGEAGYRRAHAMFGVDRFVSNHEAICAELIARYDADRTG
ncbi:MAG: glycosyl transferase group 1 family protein [Myxococcales bacterium]|nr:glycosyl transferase group 1 family protein [Myxococcales bacterium]